MPRPKTYTDAHRPELIAVTAELIASEGLDGLSVRRIAGAAGMSTSAIYTLFGSREALAAAVVGEAVDSFNQAQTIVLQGSDATEDLRRLGEAYRAWALANRSLYEVMFSGRVSAELLEGSGRAMDPLVGVLSELAAGGRLVGGEPRGAALAIWSCVHGAVSLEMALWPQQATSESEMQYDVVLESVERAWVCPAETGSA